MVVLSVFKDNKVVESFRNIPETNVTLTEFTRLTNIAAGMFSEPERTAQRRPLSRKGVY